MEKLISLIGDKVAEAFEQAGYDAALGRVTVSNRPDLCEYQCNGALAAAKQYHKAPIAIANDVVAALRANGGETMFSMIEAVAPGFINLNVSDAFLAAYANDMANCGKEGRYGIMTGEKKTIVMDYGGANVAKPLHVGHLRSAIIGESIKRINRYMGNEVIADVHLGDWGLQMGLVIEELRDRKPELPYFDENFTGEYPEEAPFTLSELSDIYPFASKKSKEKGEDGELTEEAKAFAERAHQATVKLQKGDPACTAIWNHIMRISLPDLEKNYGNLKVDFDVWKGESDSKPYIEGMVNKMVEDGLAYESQGALVVDVSREDDTKEIPPCLIRKTDGAALYTTSDLATILQRQQDYKPDTLIYVTDKRQEMHFTQVFRTAKKAGIVPESCELTWIGFGTMNGKDGKPFKTREGGVMRLEDLCKQINDAAYDKMMENRAVEELEAKETAGLIGLAALKYGDLSNQASKDYVFDLDRFMAFEGNTGPYILYTIVRIKSILKKAQAEGKGLTDAATICSMEGNASAKNLLLQASRWNEVMETVYSENAPHRLCAFLFDLSDAFNSFYHETKIVSEEDETRRLAYLAMISLVKELLEQCIDLLGFSAPDKM